MRPLAIFLLLLSCGGLQAQITESKRMEEILNPRLDLASPMQNQSFQTGRGGADASGKANVKDFQFEQKFSPKAFDTKAFSAKNFWQEDYRFATRAAQTKTDPAVEKSYATKAMEVKDARESSKDYGTRQYATREADAVGKSSQKKLDDQYLGKSPMSMDAVRELLNKNK